ncbi:hypothetical protein ACFPRL_04785 [Pseudoclavibacter helvolus]
MTFSSAELMTASAPTSRAFSRRFGTTSTTTTCSTPFDLKPIAAPRPTGPAPKTTTFEPAPAPDRFTPW